MFSFFRKKAAEPQAASAVPESAATDAGVAPAAEPAAHEDAQAQRRSWIERLRGGLRKTGSSITQVFSSARIDDALYDELEAALLMADAGPSATQHLLDDLKRRVRERNAREPAAVKALLEDALADLLTPLERALEIGRTGCTVMMVVGVNGAGKTTTIGKLACHLAEARQKVLLAAADTFRAAAREQLAVWAQRVATARGAVEIVSQQGGDPAAPWWPAARAAATW
jgi:fused signal recognition particle receptor